MRLSIDNQNPFTVNSRRVLIALGIGVGAVLLMFIFAWSGDAEGARAVGDLLAVAVKLALIVAVIGLVIWIIRRGVAQGVQDARPTPTAPAADGPGTFRVIGVDRATKMDTAWTIAADSEANARAKADLEGIVVTRVERVK
jgi:hypothetical protein